MKAPSFLTNAKSFKAPEESAAAYKLLGAGKPKFGGFGKQGNGTPVQTNLFEPAAPTPPTAPVADSPAIPAPAPAPVAAAPAPRTAASVKAPVAMATVKQVSGGGKSAHAGPAKPAGRREPGFFTSLAVVLKYVMGKILLQRRERPLPGAKPVQTELALDQVKVMRNDLDDDDLEMVVLKKGGGAGAGTPVARVSKMEMTVEAWNCLTAPFRKRPALRPSVKPRNVFQGGDFEYLK